VELERFFLKKLKLSDLIERFSTMVFFTEVVFLKVEVKRSFKVTIEPSFLKWKRSGLFKKLKIIQVSSLLPFSEQSFLK